MRPLPSFNTAMALLTESLSLCFSGDKPHITAHEFVADSATCAVRTEADVISVVPLDLEVFLP